MKAAQAMEETFSAGDINSPEKVPLDLRQFIEILEAEGDLVRVTEEVDPRNFELSAMVQLMENGANKVMLFENVKGHDIPVIANLYGSIHRAALSLGLEPSDEEIERYKDDPKGSPGGMAGMSGRKFNAFAMDSRTRAELVMVKELLLDADKRAHAKECEYVMVDSGRCQEVVITENINVLKELPVVWHVKQDASPYITPAGLVQKDPDNGLLNIGVRRHMALRRLAERLSRNGMNVARPARWR
jgi:4-hydroxy-3-polyprenylbenzoate decarboxylase